MFRLSSDKTPMTFADGVSQEVKEQFLAFLSRCDARDEKNKLRMASLLGMRNDRDEMCKLLGFSDYAAYLASPLWKGIRRRIFRNQNRVCVRCDGRADDVHHRNYSLAVMRGDGDNDDQLASICEGCHAVVHRDDAGCERLMDEWDAILFEKDVNTDFPSVKIDRRRSRWKQEHPAEWSRMSAVRRLGWNNERDRQFDLSLRRNV